MDLFISSYLFTIGSFTTISNASTNLTYTPKLTVDLADNKSVTFKTVNLINSSTYGGESLQSIFEEQTTGSGFTASLQFDSASQDAPYSFDAVTLEFTEHSHS